MPLWWVIRLKYKNRILNGKPLTLPFYQIRLVFVQTYDWYESFSYVNKNIFIFSIHYFAFFYKVNMFNILTTSK